ncbi:MAG: P-loop NTPase [Eubacterium sp.]|nr:P-loop NTPase [Eubacterium sp.]
MKLSKFIVITGHYGCGKTNVAVNIALQLAGQDEKVTVVDLDIVNPYFRTADFKELLGAQGAELIAPMYANSNLDIPALDFDLRSMREKEGYIIIDVGGDDEGAKALGRFLPVLKNDDTTMLYVVNRYRYLTREPEEALELMREIEAASGLKCDGIINNSNLGAETDFETVEKSLPYADELSRVSGLPITATCCKAEYADKLPNSFPINVYVKKLWEE